MLIHRAEHPQWLSNSYLVAGPTTAKAILIDGHGQGESLIQQARAEGLDVTLIILTHHHADHVDIAEYLEVFDAPVLAHALTAQQLGEVVEQTVEHGEKIRTGGLEIEVLHTPGHDAGHIALLINGTACFTADALFKGTVGGTRAPGATGLSDLRHSVMDVLLGLPDDVTIHPGHCEASTIGEERRTNPFIRAWSGRDNVEPESCLVGGEPATLLLWAPDYDGTHKAYVRLASGEEAVVGGSQIQRDAVAPDRTARLAT